MYKSSVTAICMLSATAAFIIAAVGITALLAEMPVWELTRDAATVARTSPLVGLLSNLGVLLWCAAAAVLAFSAAMMHRAGEKERALFLIGFAFLTLLLLLDDLFMLHDYFMPGFLGIRERYVMTAYMALTAGLLYRFRVVISLSSYIMLGLALFSFAASVGVDVAIGSQKSWLVLVEDGAKFLGIVFWAGYFIGHSYRFLEAYIPEAVYEEPEPKECPYVPAQAYKAFFATENYPLPFGRSPLISGTAACLAAKEVETEGTAVPSLITLDSNPFPQARRGKGTCRPVKGNPPRRSSKPRQLIRENQPEDLCLKYPW